MSTVKSGRPIAPEDEWVPRRRSARPPRRYRGQLAARWTAGLLCAGILLVLLLLG